MLIGGIGAANNGRFCAGGLRSFPKASPGHRTQRMNAFKLIKASTSGYETLNIGQQVKGTPAINDILLLVRSFPSETILRGLTKKFERSFSVLVISTLPANAKLFLSFDGKSFNLTMHDYSTLGLEIYKNPELQKPSIEHNRDVANVSIDGGGVIVTTDEHILFEILQKGKEFTISSPNQEILRFPSLPQSIVQTINQIPYDSRKLYPDTPLTLNLAINGTGDTLSIGQGKFANIITANLPGESTPEAAVWKSFLKQISTNQNGHLFTIKFQPATGRKGVETWITLSEEIIKSFREVSTLFTGQASSSKKFDSTPIFWDSGVESIELTFGSVIFTLKKQVFPLPDTNGTYHCKFEIICKSAPSPKTSRSPKPSILLNVNRSSGASFQRWPNISRLSLDTTEFKFQKIDNFHVGQAKWDQKNIIEMLLLPLSERDSLNIPIRIVPSDNGMIGSTAPPVNGSLYIGPLSNILYSGKERIGNFIYLPLDKVKGRHSLSQSELNSMFWVSNAQQIRPQSILGSQRSFDARDLFQIMSIDPKNKILTIVNPFNFGAVNLSANHAPQIISARRVETYNSNLGVGLASAGENSGSYLKGKNLRYPLILFRNIPHEKRLPTILLRQSGDNIQNQSKVESASTPTPTLNLSFEPLKQGVQYYTKFYIVRPNAPKEEWIMLDVTKTKSAVVRSGDTIGFEDSTKTFIRLVKIRSDLGLDRLTP